MPSCLRHLHQVSVSQHVGQFSHQHQQGQWPCSSGTTFVGPFQLTEAMDQRSKSKGGTNRHVIPTFGCFFGNFCLGEETFGVEGTNLQIFLFVVFWGKEGNFWGGKGGCLFPFFLFFLRTGSFVFKRKWL